MLRYAILERDTGLVHGDGATEAEAWADAERTAKAVGVEMDHPRAVAYHDTTCEVRVHGGVVQLLRRNAV